jgi:hypothetical protein
MNPSLNCRFFRTLSSRPLALLAVLAVTTIALVGCNISANTKNASDTSGIRVVSDNNSVVLTTSSAEFQFLANGYLRASLLRDASRSTLDDSQPGADSEYLESGGKQARDFQFDLSRVAISDVSGGSSTRGKRVEIVGKSSSIPDLQQTISLEAYGELPNVVVTGVTYKNTGRSAISLDQVVSQSHVLNAANSEPNAASYSMWSFHGSSEAWGTDDVVQITNKFDRKNPMQTVMHNDENQTSGGLLVVAFWTRSVGEAVGSAETVPLPMAIPVHTGGQAPLGRI